MTQDDLAEFIRHRWEAVMSRRESELTPTDWLVSEIKRAWREDVEREKAAQLAKTFGISLGETA